MWGFKGIGVDFQARVAGLFSAEIQLPKLNFFDPVQAALAAASAGDATGSRPIGSRVCSVSTNESARLTGILGEGPSKVTVTAKMITCNHSQMKSGCFQMSFYQGGKS